MSFIGDDHGLSSPKPQKKSKLKRRISYAGVGMCFGALLALHFMPGSMLLDSLERSAEQRDCTLHTPEVCDFSLLTGSGHIDHIKLILNDTKQTFVDAHNIDCTFSPMSSLFSDETKIESISIDSLFINLRSQNPAHEYWSEAFQDLKKRLASKQPQEKSGKSSIQLLYIDKLSILWPLPSAFDIESMQAKAELHDNGEIKIEVIGQSSEQHQIELNFTISEQKSSGQLKISIAHIEDLKDTTITPKMGSLFRLLQPKGHYRIQMNFEAGQEQTDIWIQAYSKDSRLEPKPFNTIWMNAVQNLGRRMNIMRDLEKQKGLEPIELRWDYKITVPKHGPIGENYGISLLFEQVNKRIQEIR